MTLIHSARAMFGGLLWGDKAVRYIIMDETGTSAKEPFTLVVALVVDADRQVLLAEQAINEVASAVPPEFGDGFVFHATDLFSNRAYRDSWAQSDRFGMLRDMMALPRRLGIPLCFSLVRRSDSCLPGFEDSGLSFAEQDHYMAFLVCVAQADKYMRNYAATGEVGTVIAEDVPSMKGLLRRVPQMLRERPYVLPPGCVELTQADRERGYTDQRGDFRVTRIRNCVLFAEKGEESLLQMADACAFGLRRYFGELSHGEDFMRAICGASSQLPPLEDFRGPMSGYTLMGPS